MTKTKTEQTKTEELTEKDLATVEGGTIGGTTIVGYSADRSLSTDQLQLGTKKVDLKDTVNVDPLAINIARG